MSVRVKRLARRVIFTYRNLLHSVKLPRFEVQVDARSGIRLRGARLKDVGAAMNLIRSFSGSDGMSIMHKALYMIVGKKLMYVAVKGSGRTAQVVGVEMFYFNRRDVKDGTIHEGFIAVNAAMQGKGIGAMLRENALSHFKRTCLIGVSSRISIENSSSLRSAIEVGFEPTETYYDPHCRTLRHYLIKKFQ